MQRNSKVRSNIPVGLLVAIALLTVFVVQNGTPSIALRFFGTTSLSLPLGLWVAGAGLAGAITAWVFDRLFQWGQLDSEQRKVDRPRERGGTALNQSEIDRNWVETGDELHEFHEIEDEPRRPPRHRRPPVEEIETTVAYQADPEIWDDEEEWDEEEYDEYEAEEPAPSDYTGRTYEIEQKPVESYREGTVYSYQAVDQCQILKIWTLKMSKKRSNRRSRMKPGRSKRLTRTNSRSSHRSTIVAEIEILPTETIGDILPEIEIAIGNF